MVWPMELLRLQFLAESHTPIHVMEQNTSTVSNLGPGQYDVVVTDV
jgi:hypothetical protein